MRYKHSECFCVLFWESEIMERAVLIEHKDQIFDKYRDTPISKLIEYHNLGREYDQYQSAELLVGMCMDHRKHLHIPDNFSYIIRSGGANLRFSEFKVSFAIAVGGVQHIAVIGHTNCGMVQLKHKKEEFISGLVERGGWMPDMAESHFVQYAPIFGIENEIDFVLEEVKRLRLQYPNVIVAPMLYKVEDNKLYLLHEDNI